MSQRRPFRRPCSRAIWTAITHRRGRALDSVQVWTPTGCELTGDSAHGLWVQVQATGGKRANCPADASSPVQSAPLVPGRRSRGSHAKPLADRDAGPEMHGGVWPRGPTGGTRADRRAAGLRATKPAADQRQSQCERAECSERQPRSANVAPRSPGHRIGQATRPGVGRGVMLTVPGNDRPKDARP